MNKPAIMVLDDKPDGLGALERALRHRYEHDYLIVSHISAAAALGHLTELGAAGRPVAVVLAASTLATSGTEFLAAVRGAQPAAKRVLMVPRGGPAAPSLRVPTPLLQDRSTAQPALQAMALGAIDAYLPAPGTEPDEQFHRGVSELLEEQARQAAPAQPAVWIIGHPQSARSHQLRDLLTRNSIPSAFDAADSEQGKDPTSPPPQAPRLAGPKSARPCSWKPVCPASSPRATSVTAPSNVSPPPSAKVRSPPPSSPSTCKTTRDLRKGQKHENLPRAPRHRRAVLHQRIAPDKFQRLTATQGKAAA